MEQIGRYKIEGELGHGGYGRVYKAFDPTVGRTVAIKVLVAGGDADLLARFRQEAWAAGKLRHRNIVTIHDFGEHEGIPYLVMEHLQGQDLQKLTKTGGRLGLLQTVSVMAQVAAGLHHAHVNGIIHRDVKPANIMVLDDGTVKIMDFGIARLMTSPATRITQHGDLLGTVAYMAPEQFHEMDVDELCDIFAYGVIYYELLAGEHPFAANDAGVLIYKITSADPLPLRALAPECPPELEQIVLRALRKRREARYQSLEDLQFDVAPIRVRLERAYAATLVAKAEEALSSGNVDEANILVRQALDIDANSDTARAVRENIRRHSRIRKIRERTAAAIESARADLMRKEYERAIQSLESALRLDPDSSEVLQVLEEARSALQRSETAAARLQQAEADLESENLTGAYRNIIECLYNAPENQDAAQVLIRIRRQIEQREREREFGPHSDRPTQTHGYQRSAASTAVIDDRLSRITDKLAAKEFKAARDALHAALEVQDSAGLRNLDRWLEDQEPHPRGDEQGARMADAQIGTADYAGAVTLLQNALKECPSDLALTTMLAGATRYLQAQKRDRSIALDYLLDKTRTIHHDRQVDVDFRSLSNRTEPPQLDQPLVPIVRSTPEAEPSDEELADIAARIAALRIRGDVDQANALVIDAIRKYANRRVLTELRKKLLTDIEARKRAMAARQAAAEAQALLDAEQLDEAIAFLEGTLVRFPGAPELVSLLAYANDTKAARERTHQITGIAREARTLLDHNLVEEAASLLHSGIQRFPSEEALTALFENATAARATAAEDATNEGLQVAIEAARARVQAKDAESAVAILETAAHTHGGESHLKLALAEARQHVIEQRAHEDLLRTVADARDAARANDFEAALAKLRSLPPLHRDSPEAKAAFAEIERMKVSHGREFAAGEALHTAEEFVNSGQLSDALQCIDAGLARAPDHPDLLDQRRRIESALARNHAEQAKETAPEAPTTTYSVDAAPPVRRRRIALSAVAALVLAGAAGGVFILMRGPSGTSVEVTTSPAGAAVRIGDRNCPRSPCTFTLPKGRYNVSAELPAYAVAQQQLDVARGNGALHLVLQPLPTRLRVLTNFENGTVALDGKSLGVLRGGEVSIGDLGVGPHTIHIKGGGDESATLRFSAAPGAPPAVTSPIEANRLGIVAVGSVASHARFSGTGEQSIFVAGKQVALGQGAVVNDLGQATVDVRLGSSDGPVFTLARSPAPVLTVLVRAARNTGTLLVSTQMDGVAVFLDRTRYVGTTEHGVISIPLPVRRYTVSVDKSGFISSAPQQIEISKNEIRRVAFNLRPQPAKIVISGAADGTNILLDGKPLGTVSGSRSFEVNPGNHELSITRPNYVSKRIQVRIQPGRTLEIGGPEVELAAAPPQVPVEPSRPEPKAPVASADVRDWEQIRNSNDPDAFENYRRKYPDSHFADQALRKAGELTWERLRNGRDPKALRSFLDKHSSAPFASDVRKRIEQIAWESVDHKNPASLRAFAGEYPASPFSQQALREIATLEETSRQAAEEQAIKAVIERFRKAFEEKDVAGLHAVWPNMPAAVARMMRETRSMSLKMSPLSVSITGIDATAVCKRELVQRFDGATTREWRGVATVQLRRNGAEWVVQSVQYAADEQR